MIEAVSTISKFVITGDGILVWDFMVDGRMRKDSVIEAVSTISSLTPRLGWDLVYREELSWKSETRPLLLASIPMEELWD